MSDSCPLVADAEALDLVCQLMAIPAAGGAERAVMDFLAARLAEAGVPAGALRFDNAHELSVRGGGCGNGVLDLPGVGSLADAPRRLFLAHTDTVPVCLGSKPELRDGIVRSADPTTGLGADDRSGTAVLLTTALGLLRSGVDHPPLTFLWTVQEEGGIDGARHVDVSMLGSPALAFNFDGGSPSKLTVGATGGYKLRIDVQGYPSHAGIAPEKGVSAAAIAGVAIADLVENGWHGLVVKGDQTGTSNIGTLTAGVATNVVAEHARLEVEARSHQAAFRQQIVASIEGAFLRAAERVVSSDGRRGEVRFTGRVAYESFQLPPDDPSVAAASAAVRALGHEPQLAVSNGGLDANWLTSHGVPAVSLGTGQHNIHTIDEELHVAEYHLARRIAWHLATGG